jgi:hypothetical protein
MHPMKIGAMDAIRWECICVCALFNCWSSSHTKEAQLQKGSRTFNMYTSYDGSLLDHIAEYMIYLSTASSFLFSLNSSYDHEFHLSKQFGMSPQDLEHLLVAAHLGHFHTKWGFSIKKIEVESLR